MSEPIPESVPTSMSSRSQRPTKKRALTPSSQQSAQVEALFANPERAQNGLAIGPKARMLAPPPEIVANVQGSSAGAGSGEFHVYKASRRREYERLRMMDEEVKAEEDEREFREKKEEQERRDEEKLGKNRAKREKMKRRQEKKQKKPLDEEGKMNVVANDEGTKKDIGFVKKKLGPAKSAVPKESGVGDADVGEAVAGDLETVGEQNQGLTIIDDD